MADFGLSPEALELIRSVLRKTPEVREAHIFGSRALGTHRPNSDIDLALRGDLTPDIVGHIKFELEELPLPYTFDVVDFATLTHLELRKHIEDLGRMLFCRDGG